MVRGFSSHTGGGQSSRGRLTGTCPPSTRESHHRRRAPSGRGKAKGTHARRRGRLRRAIEGVTIRSTSTSPTPGGPLWYGTEQRTHR